METPPPEARDHISNLLYDAAWSPDASVYTYKQGDTQKPIRTTYQSILSSAIRNSSKIQRIERFSTDRIILIHFNNHLDNIIWFWSAVIAGCTPALSTPLTNNPKDRQAHLKHLYYLLGDPICLTAESSLKSDFSQNELLQIHTAESLSTPQSNSNFFPDLNFQMHRSLAMGRDTPAVLMLTSGSTGNAKAVSLSHKQIYSALVGKMWAFPSNPNTALMNWVGLDHVAGLVEIHFCALYARLGQVHVQASDMLSDPLVFLKLIQRHEVSRSFAPNFFLAKLQRAITEPKEAKSWNLRCLQFIASGGEANVVDTCDAVSKLLVPFGAPRNVITPGFGMTETCAGAIFNTNCPTYDVSQGNEFASLGTCVPGIEMRVSTPENVSHDSTGDLESGTKQGLLELRGTTVFHEYFNNASATRDAFTPDGWFKTGDWAVIDAQGQLNFLGRSNDAISINGVKYVPHEIEAALEEAEIAGVTPTFTACFSWRAKDSKSQTEACYVVYESDYEPDDVEARVNAMNAIVRTVLLATGSRPLVLPLAKGILQKSTLGKLSRTKIRKALERGDYSSQQRLNDAILDAYRATHLTGPKNDLEVSIARLVENIADIGRDEIRAETPIYQTGITSVDLIRLKRLIEERFAIEIPLITIMTQSTVRALATAVETIINKTSEEISYDPVVPLQTAGTKTPLWLVHPGVGEILVFVGLAKFLADRPVYAFRAKGFNDGEAVFANIDEVVETYTAAMKRTQPHGPYAIAGYSYGSMLAFEMAKRLEAQGDAVKFFGCFNLPPHIKTRMRQLNWTNCLLHLAYFSDLISEPRADELSREVHAAGLPRDQVVDRLFEVADPARLAELVLTRSSLSNWADVAYSLQSMAVDYEPSGWIRGMDVFFCHPLRIAAPNKQEWREKHLSHWQDFAGDVRWHEVDGAHYTMLAPEYVMTFQRRLKGALEARGL